MKNIVFFISIIFSNKLIISQTNNCFEFSCEECESPKYGACTKCRNGFRLINGTCPCFDPACAICYTGLAGLNLCYFCKNGYYNEDYECKCEIDNCEICKENKCLLCKAGYAYNETEKKCEKENESNRIHCFDENCDGCFNNLKGGCEICKKGYFNEKGECIQLPSINENNKCPNGYYLDNDFKTCEKICDGVSCTKRKVNRYECESNNCLYCYNNLLYLYQECDNSRICTKEGCLNCITNDECVICTQGYFLLGGICKKCINGCSFCTNNETCINCMSGFELNSLQECIQSENFDFNVNKYKIYKNKLIKMIFPKEPISDFEIIENSECDRNCKKCYQNTGKCIECKLHYRLEDNKCIKQCSDINCLQCSLFYDYEKCNQCRQGYKIEDEKCIHICNIPGCIDCTIENDKEICNKCNIDYKINNGSCKKKINLGFIVLSAFWIIILIIVIFFCCICRKRRNENRRILLPRINPENVGRNVIVRMANNEIEGSERPSINKKDLEEEFEILKRKMEKGNHICQFCKKKEGKFICDCGCIVCKEHSNLKKKEGDNENNKVCFSCEKIVKNVTPIRYDCDICFQKKINVAHFKCGCSLKVCKECYIKCKMINNKCPGCRAII